MGRIAGLLRWIFAAATVSASCTATTAAHAGCEEEFVASRAATQVVDEGGRVRNGAWIRRPESDTVIVFVHGIFSNSRDAWLASDSPCTYWPVMVSKDAAFAKAGIFVAGYYADSDAGNFDVRQAAIALRDVLARNYDETFAPSQYPKVLFVAHSLGGIVTRRMLAKYWNTPQAHDRIGLMLMASPSRGSAWATRAFGIADYFKLDMAAQLRPGDPVLDEIHNEFVTFFKTRNSGLVAGQEVIVGTEQFENHFLFCKQAGLWGCLWTNSSVRNVVDPADQGGYFASAAQVVPDTDHMTIVKPYGTGHLSHIRLQAFYNQQFRTQLIEVATGPGRLEVAGERPTYGWREVHRTTLSFFVHGGLCSSSSPSGCRKGLSPPRVIGGEVPRVGDERWVPIDGEEVSAGSPYMFKLELSDPTRPTVWASLPNGAVPTLAHYEKQFKLEQFGETGRDQFKKSAPLCAPMYCRFEIEIPSDVEVKSMREVTAIGEYQTAWVSGKPVVGRAVRFGGSRPSATGTSLVFNVAPP